MAWLGEYEYRKKIPVDTRSEGSLTNYNMSLIVYSGAGSDSAGTIYLQNSSQNWPYDIRFTQSDGDTELDYFYEQSGNKNNFSGSKCWIEIPTISNSADTDYYLYFGSSNATDASQVGATFFPDYFDHWTSDNTSDWTKDEIGSNHNIYIHDVVDMSSKYKKVHLVGTIEAYTYEAYDYSYIGFCYNSGTGGGYLGDHGVFIRFCHDDGYPPDTTHVWARAYARSGGVTYASSYSGSTTTLAETIDMPLELDLCHDKDYLEYSIKNLSSQALLMKGSKSTGIPGSSNTLYFMFGGLDISQMGMVYDSPTGVILRNGTGNGDFDFNIDQWFISDYSYPEPIWDTPGSMETPDGATYQSDYLIDTLLSQENSIQYKIDTKLYSVSSVSMDIDAIFKQFDSTTGFKIDTIVGVPSTPDVGDIRIYYGDLAENYYLDCYCNRWDVQNYQVTIETMLTKSESQTLRDNITPGATRIMYKILDRPVYYDTTWDGSNTLKLVPRDGYSFSIMRRDTIMYVKNYAEHPIGGGLINIKITAYISGSQEI